MNILEHLRRGHYERDDHGRRLVPVKSGWTATILTTRGPGTFPIIGFGRASAVSWDVDGTPWCVGGTIPDDILLPPTPQTMIVKRWIVRRIGDETQDYTALTRSQAHSVLARKGLGWHIIELTGQYEIPWE